MVNNKPNAKFCFISAKLLTGLSRYNNEYLICIRSSSWKALHLRSLMKNTSGFNIFYLFIVQEFGESPVSTIHKHVEMKKIMGREGGEGAGGGGVGAGSLSKKSGLSGF